MGEVPMSRPLSTEEMNWLQLMRCPVCLLAYIVETTRQTPTCYVCKQGRPELQHINPFAIRRS